MEILARLTTLGFFGKKLTDRTLKKEEVVPRSRKEPKAELISVEVIAAHIAKVCSKCQIAHPADDKFCLKGEKKLLNCHVPKYVKCGARMAPFCANCGRREDESQKGGCRKRGRYIYIDCSHPFKPASSLAGARPSRRGQSLARP